MWCNGWFSDFSNFLSSPANFIQFFFWIESSNYYPYKIGRFRVSMKIISFEQNRSFSLNSDRAIHVHANSTQALWKPSLRLVYKSAKMFIVLIAIVLNHFVAIQTEKFNLQVQKQHASKNAITHGYETITKFLKICQDSLENFRRFFLALLNPSYSLMNWKQVTEICFYCC